MKLTISGPLKGLVSAAVVAADYISKGYADEGRRKHRDCVLYVPPDETHHTHVWGDREHVRVYVQEVPRETD